MNFIKKNLLFFLFLLGLLVRLSLMFVDYSWDVNNHMVWARDFLTRGAQGFYETQSSNVFAYLTPNYPPLAIFTFVIVYPLQSIIHGAYWWLNLHISFIPSNLIFFMEKTVFMAGLFKLPGIAADLGLAFICYLIACKIVPKNKKIQLLAPALILFNPAFIFNSALWGQIDSLPIFFVLWSIYLLLYSRRDIISALLFTVAILIKPTALVFLPAYSVLFIKKFGLRSSFLNLVIANVFFIASFLPFMKDKNIFTYPYELYSKGILAAQSLPYVTNGAFNFWTLITGFKEIKDTVPLIWNISYRLIGYLVVALTTIFLLMRVYTNKIREQTIFATFFLISFAAFLFLTKMHERYSLLPLVFLLLFSLKNQKNFRWFILLSIISLINHYHSWAVPWIPSLAGVIRSAPFIFIISLLNVGLFFYFSIQFYFGKVLDKKIG